MWVGYGIGFITGLAVMAGIETLLAEKWRKELGLEVEDDEYDEEESEEDAAVTDYDVLDHCHCDSCKRNAS